MIIDPYNFQSVEILAKETIADDTISIITNKPNHYDFAPGQYAVVKTLMTDGASRTRQYSFANSPSNSNLEFLIRKQPNGEVSNWFSDTAKIGNTIYISSALGSFTRRNTNPTLLIAGGSGIAPFLSMLRTDTTGLNLIYSERSSTRLCYNEELSEVLGDRYFPIVSSEVGRITISTLKDLPSYKSIYICGSKVFVDDINDTLVNNNYPTSAIKRELFTLQ